ncbi:unnamed protein product [Rhizophagus irregularis]|nr:unnamed protein product [Rhizophagus irregularis]
MSENTQPSHKKPKGPVKYHPHYVSNNKLHAGRMIVNKYAKGKAKYEHYESNKSGNIDENDEYMDIDENTEEWDDFYNAFHDIKNKKQKYYNEQISLMENWQSIIPIIFNSIIEGQGFSENSFCIKCKKEAILKCLDCGPNIYFCHDCDILFHDVINIFHQRITKNSQDNSSTKIIRLSQICLGECKHEILKVLCVDIKGKYNIEVPICNGLIKSLIYNKLFPSTPIRPSVVFTFNILDLYKELLCEAQVPYLAFCRVLETLHMNNHITRNIYFSFISAFQQYIGIKSKINDEILKLYQETKPLFTCPACPQPQEDNAKVIIALDGNFQLRRLKSAGERYSLAECLISELNNLFPKDSQSLTILYDIACSLHAHVMNNNSAINFIKSKLNWGVSIFHAYAHSVKCQLKYHPRIQEGIGLTDGESLERIWSYLGRFVSNTKHMRPAHRLDILSLAIQHISNRMIVNLGGILLHRFKHAKKLEIEVTNKLSDLEKQHHVTEKIIKNTIKKQQEYTYVFKKHLQKDEIYFAHLMELQELNNKFTKCQTDKEKEVISKKTSKLLNKINHCEAELNILEDERWDPMDIKYKQYLDAYLHDQIENIVDKMRILRNEYSFKSGYLFDHNHKGHKSATKIKKSVDDIVKNINNQLIHYDKIKVLLPDELQNYPDSTLKDVLDNKSDLWKALDLNTEDNHGIPRIILYNAIQNYNNLCRSKEEQILIPQELFQLLNHWKIIKINIENKLDEIKDQKTLLMNGFMFNLKHILFKVNNIIEDCNSVINQINVQSNPTNPYQSEDKLLNEDIYLFTNEFEEVELLQGELDNITELDIIDKIDNIQEYESDTIDEIYLSSDNE